MAKQGAKTAVPRLRFPEFRKANSWRDDTLVDYATVVAGQSPEGAYYNETGEGLPFYQGKSDFGEIFLERPRKWTSQVTKRAGAGDIVMSVRAPVGALNVTTEDICIGRGLAAIQAKGSKWFLYYLLNSVSSSIIGNGGSVFDSIKKDQIEKLRLFAPRDAAEQQKIAGCLTSLDEVIAAQGRKVEALKAHKRGLMQQLFPLEGETVPRLRFPEFRNAPEWETSPLGLLIQVASGQVDPTESPYCDWPHVGGDNIEPETGNLAGLRSAREDGVTSGKYLFDERDVLYSKIRPVLNKVAVPALRGICSADIYPIRPANSDITREFLAYLLRSVSFVEYATKNSERGKIPKINREALAAYSAPLPKPSEQQRIADCLASLDTRITAESNQLAALKTHKHGLMQQLFPSQNVA